MGHAASDIKITNAWIAEAPPGASVMAAYMEVKNTSNYVINIVSIKSPAFKRIEMHLSKEADGFAKMLPQKNLPIPANSTLSLKSGGYHLMLIKPKKRLISGDKASLTFSLSNGEQLTLEIGILRKKMKSQMRCGAGKCGAGKM